MHALVYWLPPTGAIQRAKWTCPHCQATFDSDDTLLKPATCFVHPINDCLEAGRRFRPAPMKVELERLP